MFRAKVATKDEYYRHGVVVITTAQLHSTTPELRFCADSTETCLRRVRNLQ